MATQEDPLVGFNFKLDIQGTVTGFFTECAGLGSENEIITHNVVNDQGQEVVKKIPGRLKWGDITLKRGITSSMDAWNWRDLVVQGKMSDARKNGKITMLDRNLNPVAEWDFEGGWPSNISGPSLNSDGNEIGIEEITIVHELIQRTK